MKRFYLSSKKGISGICKYSRDFYELVLKERGYVFIDSSDLSSDILSTISSRDHVHIEVGIFQRKEIEILFLMLKANYKNVTITMHDAPLLKYPFYTFKSPLLNGVSKFYEKYASSMGAAIPYVKKIKAIYALTNKGVDAIKRKYGVDNVYYLPHIVNPAETKKSAANNSDFIYFGFIGRNKGIEYSLKLHQQLINKHPDSNFHVVGKPLGKEVQFYETLKERYRKNVHFYGYLEEDQLDEVFDRAMFAFIPFNNYRFFWPASGSILYSLKKGKIVITNNVNSISEIIENQRNGFMLSGDTRKDIKNISEIISDKPLLEKVKEDVYDYMMTKHSPEEVKKSFKD
ncbi:MAG: glycosyltransferase family 4 protein [Chitinophagaceae bacterium]|nr:glycosyltransferase family 4 protein [Chitinophagaceae bacterium]